MLWAATNLGFKFVCAIMESTGLGYIWGCAIDAVITGAAAFAIGSVAKYNFREMAISKKAPSMKDLGTIFKKFFNDYKRSHQN